MYVVIPTNGGHMEKYYSVLEQSELFKGIDIDSIPAALICLEATTKEYKKDDFICIEGDTAGFIGLLLEGEIQVFNIDYSGRRNLTASYNPGSIFAESIACAEISYMPVDIQAYTDCVILFIDIKNLMKHTVTSCVFHEIIIKNLLRILARKNVQLKKKLDYTSHKTTSEKLMAYLQDQAKKHHSNEFTIPFDRQGLADYLGVERSAMSAELSKLQKNGVLITKKNYFQLL